MDGMILGTIPGTDGMLLIIVMVTIAGTIGVGAGIIIPVGVGDGVIAIPHITTIPFILVAVILVA